MELGGRTCIAFIFLSINSKNIAIVSLNNSTIAPLIAPTTAKECLR